MAPHRSSLVGLLLVLVAFGAPGAFGETFTVVHFEGSALATAWARAAQLFQAAHPNVKVAVVVKSFDEMRVGADRLLTTDDVPTVMELPKGSAHAGVLAARGLLRDLSADVERQGWDRLLSPRLQATSRYDHLGRMGTGPWYGVPSYGEFVSLEYNKDLLKKAGVGVPTTFAALEAALAALKKAGIVPLALGGGDYPVQHLLYTLYLSQATRAEVDAFQGGHGDLHGPAWTWAADTLARWSTLGYFGPGALGLTNEGQVAAFQTGHAAFVVSGTWNSARLAAGPTPFDWGTTLFPGNTLVVGSAGNLWVVPQAARHPEWAVEFIGLTLGADVQTVLANAGGVALNPDFRRLTNPRSGALIRTFRGLVVDDRLGWYPDWPAWGYYDSLQAAGHDLLSGVAPWKVLEGLRLAYQTNRARQ
jgi:raffinose/stachyose/melibiose transport system substrate-binding protein